MFHLCRDNYNQLEKKVQDVSKYKILTTFSVFQLTKLFYKMGIDFHFPTLMK